MRLYNGRFVCKVCINITRNAYTKSNSVDSQTRCKYVIAAAVLALYILHKFENNE